MKNTPTAAHPLSALSAAALLEWEKHVESVLRGVAHALNNRTASLSALMSLVTEADYTAASAQSMLANDVERLREIVGVVRAMGAPSGDVEAFAPEDAARSASSVLGFHAAFRDRPVTINVSAPPVRASRWMFVRALVALAGRAAEADHGAAVVLDIREEDGWVYATTPGAGAKSAYVDEIAAALGGESLAESPGFRLPTLARLRQREGR